MLKVSGIELLWTGIISSSTATTRFTAGQGQHMLKVGNSA